MAPAISIYDSFNAAVYRPKAPATRPNAHESGPTTKYSECPRFLVPVHISVWDQLADEILEEHKDVLKGSYLPSREASAVYRTESDVVAGSTLQFVHPLHMALYQDLPTFQHGSEVQDPTKKARADKLYLIKILNGSIVNFAVLDYKRVSVIDVAEFQDGSVKTRPEFIRYIGNNDDKIDSLSSANTLLRQGVNYSCSFDTPFVAFFDMRTLVMVVYVDREDYLAGDYALVTVVQDSKRMRRAFLGFLKMASEHKFLKEDEWKSKVISPEQREWFASVGRTWSFGNEAAIKR